MRFLRVKMHFSLIGALYPPTIRHYLVPVVVRLRRMKMLTVLSFGAVFYYNVNNMGQIILKSHLD